MPRLQGSLPNHNFFHMSQWVNLVNKKLPHILKLIFGLQFYQNLAENLQHRLQPKESSWDSIQNALIQVTSSPELQAVRKIIFSPLTAVTHNILSNNYPRWSGTSEPYPTRIAPTDLHDIIPCTIKANAHDVRTARMGPAHYKRHELWYNLSQLTIQAQSNLEAC